MSVIKKEYMSEDVTRCDLLPLSFIKKSPYTGSKGGLRYRIEKEERQEGSETIKTLKVSIWHSPLAYDKTPYGDIAVREFPFSDEALDEIALYLNGNK